MPSYQPDPELLEDTDIREWLHHWVASNPKKSPWIAPSPPKSEVSIEKPGKVIVFDSPNEQSLLNENASEITTLKVPFLPNVKVFQGAIASVAPYQEKAIDDRYQQLINRAIHPNACMTFSQAQYSNRHNWNANCSGWFQKIPEPFDEEKEIEWTPVWSLTHQEFKYLPTAYCYYGYPNLPIPDCWADSNGCAAGNTIEEAILQGFMELVERDCVALWWYNRLKKPQVDLDSFDDPYFQALRKYYQTIHRELWILDITNDLNIPSFVAISRRTDRAEEDIILGFGTHFDPHIAISRALSEINQILPNVLSANADGSTKYPASSDTLAIIAVFS
ncbi:hypothetical protein CDG79_18960 [Nostoc sp. 'Peltigera membranacea cyanobiont' 232]|nr:hypothetical protein CDG79_18960 [Nostoc sp. 'Peltigera membranacea cyanobiont' 232]